MKRLLQEQNRIVGRRIEPADKKTTSDFNDLHHRLGNRATAALLVSRQTKYEISPADSPAEREADRVADNVVSHTFESTPSNITAKSGGFRCDDFQTRLSMESLSHSDFSDVRFHEGAAADKTARALNAKAFTIGNDIAFRKGQFQPHTVEGRRLLAHELSHVAQNKQRGNDRVIHRKPESGEAVGEVPTEQTKSIEIPGEKAPSHLAIVGGRIVVLTDEEYNDYKNQLIRRMENKIDLEVDEAASGKKWHMYHMEEVRGWAGTLSDWWNDIIPPWTGMWGHPIFLFNEAKKRLAEGNIRGAYSYYESGRESLIECKNKWHNYMQRTIEGAEATVTTLTYVRDAALAIEVGLLTGGAAYAAGGGGLLVTGGATLLGTGAAVTTAAALETPLGEDARGTLKEVKNAGVEKNLRYAINGLGGMIIGIGEGLTNIGKSLLTLFTDPIKFFEDLAQLPDVLSELYANRKIIWRYFANLPDEEQAYAVGRFVGNIEAVLISIKATQDISGALKDLAATSGAGMGGAVLISESGVASMTQTLGVIRIEALVVVTGQTATAAVAGGLPVAVPYSFMKSYQDVLEQLGEGPTKEAMHETGKAGAGMAEKPKHHVFPKEHRKWFEDRGFKGKLDIDEFTVELEESAHQAIHGGGDWQLGKTTPFEWNNRVMATLKQAESALGKGKKLSVEQIFEIVEKLMQEYKIPKNYVPYK